jgi:Amt family ammonium transporter
VHGIAGVWGTLSVGLFGATSDHLGLFYGGGLHQLGVQALGVVAVFAWVFGTTMILFSIIKKVIGLRVSEEEEIQGLDIGEHGMEAYPSFQIFQNQ